MFTKHKDHLRLLPVLLVFCTLLNVSALAQPEASESEQLQQRIDAATTALTRDPHLANVPHDKLQGVVEFVAGNTLFVLLHEMGHALIDDMQIPVIGQVEDGADSFATVTLLKVGSSLSHRMLVEAAKGWVLSDRSNQASGETIAYYDAHSLDKQRAYRIICMMVGSDPKQFADLASEANLPEDRQETCEADYSNASWSWAKVLEPHHRGAGQPKQRIDVSYEDATGNLERYAEAFRSIKLLEIIAAHSADQYVWRAPFALRMRTCGESNAHWYFQARELVYCYELAADFAQLDRDYGQTLPPISWVTGKPTKSAK